MTKPPLVSFIVPTLNRRRHVLRAVQSCLDVDARSCGVDIEVVVSDCASTDGSWEALQEAFGQDDRVTLVRGRSGAGPVENWLNGAWHIKGDYVTFAWSDDFIATHFIADHLANMRAGATISVGRGLERDVDENSPLPAGLGSGRLPLETFLKGYFQRGTMDDVVRPFSPACSLFARRVFDHWVQLVQQWANANPLREETMWQRAIGADLLMTLIAVADSDGGPIWKTDSFTAQFSFHPGSITYSSSRLPFETGYWIAALWFLTNDRAPVLLGVPRATHYLAVAYVYGLILSTIARFGYGKVAHPQYYRDELALISAAVRRRECRTQFRLAVATQCVLTPLRLARYALQKGIRKTG